MQQVINNDTKTAICGLHDRYKDGFDTLSPEENDCKLYGTFRWSKIVTKY